MQKTADKTRCLTTSGLSDCNVVESPITFREIMLARGYTIDRKYSKGVSASMVSTHDWCEMQSYRSMATDDAKEIKALGLEQFSFAGVYGNAFHEVMDTWLRLRMLSERQATKARLMDIGVDVYHRFMTKQPAGMVVTSEQGFAASLNDVYLLITDTLSDYRIVNVEEYFQMQYRRIKIICKMDVVLSRGADRSGLILDWKTGKPSTDISGMDQFIFYDWVMRHLIETDQRFSGIQDVTMGAYYTRTGGFPKTKKTRRDIYNLKKKLNNILEKRTFSVHRNRSPSYCRNCIFKVDCRDVKKFF